MAKRAKPRASRPSSPPRTAPPRSSRASLLAIASLVAIAALVLGVPRIPHAGTGRAIEVELPVGTSVDGAIDAVVAAGAAGSPTLVRATWTVFAHDGVRPGRHLLADDLSPLEIVRRLSGASTAREKVTIPEGFNRFDIARRLQERRVCDRDAFLAATIDPALLRELDLATSAEGWLFPSTYAFAADSDARDVVRRMAGEGKQRFERLQRDVGVSSVWSTLGLGARELMIVASIVEREAAADDERAIVASVFANRLAGASFPSHLLQADPTAVYGCLSTARESDAPPSCARWLAAGGGKTNAEIQHDPFNRWSTYTHAGLPPTAIANPGERSIAAALQPATTKYLYFVARGGGHHTFSETREAHERAVKGGAAE
jgi:UPF0755 protein